LQGPPLHNLEYFGSDLYSFLEMSRSWHYGGRLLQDNVWSDNRAIHNFYLVLAFSTPNQNLEYRNQEILRQYESKGTIVTLEPGQKAEVKLSVLTEDEE